MGSYWKGVKERWGAMVKGELPTETTGRKSGSGGDHSSSRSSPVTPPNAQWERIYQKFRQIHGRHPYSHQEVVDWWT